MASVINEMARAVFLDKDGTLVRDIPYNVDPDRVEYLPGVLENLAALRKVGYKLILVTNQAGIARGMFDQGQLNHLMQAFQASLATHDARLDAIYFCPHHPCGIVDNFAIDCNCRKPKPGMILTAARDHGVNLSQSWMIGDILHDVEAGNRAGCRSILIDNGNETEWDPGEYRVPSFSVRNFSEAAAIILSKSGSYDSN